MNIPVSIGADYQPPPHNIDAEQALLGALLVNNAASERLPEGLCNEHFFEPIHNLIYDAIMTAIEAGRSVTPVTLKAAFDGDPALEDHGGAQYLARLAGCAVTLINIGDYGQIVLDLALRRELIQVGGEMIEAARSAGPEDAADVIIESTEAKLYRIAESNSYGGIENFDQLAASALASAAETRRIGSRQTGVSSGIHDLDRALGGLGPGHLIIIAGRPSMGKTALATSVCANVARRGEAVGFFSLEMTAPQIQGRMLAAESGISQTAIRDGTMTDQQWHRYAGTVETVGRWPVHIDPTTFLSATQFRARARRMKRRYDVQILVVDHIQLMRGAGSGRLEQLTDITGTLKGVANELGIPVLALSQLNRSVESRDGHLPTLADLRESGSIEQDADAVGLMFRAAYYMERNRPEPKSGETKDAFAGRFADWEASLSKIKHQADLHIAKNRHGETANVRLYFDPATSKFSGLERPYEAAA